MIKLVDILKQILEEDRCKRIADRKYDKPSAYKSGAIVRCRKGNIWKDLKEEEHKIYAKQNFEAELIEGELGNLYHSTNVTAALNIIKQNQINPANITLKNYIGTDNPPWWYNDEFGDPQPLYGDFIYAASKEKGNFYGVSNPEITFVIDGDKVKNSGINIYKAPENMEEGVCLIQGSVKLDFIKNVIINRDFINKEDITGIILLLKNKKVKYIVTENIKEDESLHKWFKRSGTPGKEGGWVDCNAPIKKDNKITGYKACGRKEGEKRSKYPSCRPTPSQCKTPGKGKKWGKTK